MRPMMSHIGGSKCLMTIAFSVAKVGGSADRNGHLAIIPENPDVPAKASGSSLGSSLLRCADRTLRT